MREDKKNTKGTRREEYYYREHDGVDYLLMNKCVPFINPVLDKNYDKYTYGLLSDGTAFVAEIWHCRCDLYLTIVMPKKTFSLEEILKNKVLLKEAESFTFDEGYAEMKADIYKNFGSLKEVEDNAMVGAYVDYLVAHRLICFVGKRDYAYADYACDIAYNDVVIITVPLIEDREVNAITPLKRFDITGEVRRDFDNQYMVDRYFKGKGYFASK